MKILLLEDDVMLNEAVCEYLQSAGHRVVTVGNGLEALDTALETPFDLLLLDITVPKLSGLALLEALHKNHIDTPAIFISALVDIEEITRAFDLGCYDYLKKPFHLRELGLRIDRVLSQGPRDSQGLRLGRHYRYDAAHRILYYDGEPQTLTRRQYQIIDLLAKNLNAVVDFDHFREEVWDEYVDNATIRAEVNRLKKSLKEEFILNIRAMGYMIDEKSH